MLLKKSYREESHIAGYDLEEEYFYRRNRELIELLHASGESQRLSPLLFKALPASEPRGRDKWLARLFKPLPTGIYSFPV